MQYKVQVYNEIGCVDAAYVTVKVFATLPTVFVPDAFTPNGDGKNDLLKPIMAGIQKMEYFTVYNRWGQLVYQLQANEQSWNGSVNGKAQPTGAFIWVVKAVDYNGNPYFKKGIVTLIR